MEFWWGPDQDVHFLYSRSHLSAPQSCKSIISTHFQKYLHYNSQWRNLVFDFFRRPKSKKPVWLFSKLTYNFVCITLWCFMKILIFIFISEKISRVFWDIFFLVIK